MSYDEHLISMAGGDGDVLDQIQARVDAATKGPWKVWGMSIMSDPLDTSDLADSHMIARTNDPHRGLRTFNADFMAAARTDIPTLLAMVREQRAVIERVRELCDSIPRSLEREECEPPDTDYALFGFSNTIRATLTTSATP